ncbi:hypothetical protein BH11MYX4_BH11MYX4_39720 [soil metagenome]
MNRTTLGLAAVLLLTTSAVVLACSSSTSNSSSSSGSSGEQSTAAAVAGAADTHCAGKPVVVADPAACHPAETDAGHDHDADVDAGDHDAGGEGASEYGATLYGSEGEDDECKYHVTWTSSPVTKDADVTLAIVATNRKDSSPVAAATPYAEIFLNDTTPGPNTPVKTTETSPGKYTIGPVRFSASGKWTVRFHFSADCADGETSPHGHVAFFVNVP